MRLRFTTNSSTKLISAMSFPMEVDGDESEYSFWGVRPKWSIVSIRRFQTPSSVRLEEHIRFNDDDELPNNPMCPHRIRFIFVLCFIGFSYYFSLAKPTVRCERAMHVVRIQPEQRHLALLITAYYKFSHAFCICVGNQQI